jgi:hypothetical protein
VRRWLQKGGLGGDRAASFLERESFRSQRERRVAFTVCGAVLVYAFTVGLLLHYGLWTSVRLALFMGLPSALGAIGLTKLREVTRRRPVWLAVLILAVSYTAWFTFTLISVAALIPTNPARPDKGMAYFFTHEAWWLYPVFFVWLMLVFLGRGVSRKLGPGVFLNWLFGYYQRPRTETRVFMFLDMRDSTKLAESLGDLSLPRSSPNSCMTSATLFRRPKAR